MEHVIYADVLIFLNTVVTFILLLSVKDVAAAETSAGRLAAGAFVGGVYSLIILAPPMNFFLVMLTRAIMGVSLIFITFRTNDLRKLLKMLLIFLASTFALAGIAFCASALLPGGFLCFNNGYGYAELGAGSLIAITAVTYVCVRLLRKRFFTVSRQDFIYDAEISRNDRSVKCRALFDSGNSLTDLYTGRPVVIVGPTDAGALLCPSEKEELAQALAGVPVSGGALKLRLLPAATVAGNKLLPAFTVSRMTVDRDGRSYITDRPVLAVTENDFGNEKFTALINEAVFR